MSYNNSGFKLFISSRPTPIALATADKFTACLSSIRSNENSGSYSIDETSIPYSSGQKIFH